MTFPFSVSENDLTNALLHNIALRSTGSRSKADARAQAAGTSPGTDAEAR